MIKPWPIIESTNTLNTSLFSVTTNRCRSPRTGKEHDFYVIDFPNWVQVIPLTPEDQIVMVKQYRHGCGRILFELPGGLIDKSDLSPDQTARRELLEETGYHAKDLHLLTHVYPQPAVLTNKGLTYLAKDVKKVAEPALDAAEDIEVCLIKLQNIPQMIKSGEINHGQTVMALSVYFLLNK